VAIMSKSRGPRSSNLLPLGVLVCPEIANKYSILVILLLQGYPALLVLLLRLRIIEAAPISHEILSLLPLLLPLRLCEIPGAIHLLEMPL
jgi:hypothetical protein